MASHPDSTLCLKENDGTTATTNCTTSSKRNDKRYPFAAIVGQEDLKLCLILCAIDPTIGGVLIRGDKGTAKSTAARGLATLLPPIEVAYDPKSGALDPYNQSLEDIEDATAITTTTVNKLAPAPFVDLPIGATEDRVLGSIDFAATLQDAQNRRVFAPGLLAAANRGILYVDEVNLLPSHLVDVLLDAAAMGVNTVQREGITKTHPAKFLLIGTMNPEEGDLRPQLLDRFGLMVDVAAPSDPKVRAEVVRQRIAFDRDPLQFGAKWDAQEVILKEKIQAAKDQLSKVALSDELLLLISTICTELKVSSLRADITLYKAATALTAWKGRMLVEAEDVKQVVPWVLAHRRRRQPFESPTMNEKETNDLLDQLIEDSKSKAAPPAGNNEEQQQQDHQEEEEGKQQQDQQKQEPEGSDSSQGPQQDVTDNRQQSDNENDANDDNKQMQTFTASKPEQIKRLKLGKQQKGQPGSGKRNLLFNAPQQKGHYVRSVQTDKPVDLALDATLRAAAINGLHPDTGRPIIHQENWRRKVRTATTGTVILFVVDASGSMSARQRMEAVKGAVVALLTDAYQQRDCVGVIAFRGLQAEVLLEPTRSVELAEQKLQRLPTGGRTPLAHALSLTLETIQRLCRYEPEQAILLIVLSDGKANVPLPASAESGSGDDAWTQTEQVATQLASHSIPTLFLDTETGHVRIGRGQELSKLLKADYLRLDDLSADGLVHTIRQAY